MRYIAIFQIMEPRNLLKPDLETSVTFEPLGFFDVVFTLVLRRMSSIILYNAFIYIRVSLSTIKYILAHLGVPRMIIQDII